MGTEFQEVLCGEHSISGDGEYCGDNDTQLGRIKVFYHEASGGKYAPRAVFFDLEPGMIGAVRASPLGELFRPGNLVNLLIRQKRRPARCASHQARLRLRLAARSSPGLRYRLAAHGLPVARRGRRPARECLVFEPPRPDVQFLLVDRSSRSMSCNALRCTARRHRGLPCTG
jgi:hypothetical protein